jgi:hypothetical protein
MVDPVPSGIRGGRKVTYGVSVDSVIDFVIEMEEDAEGSLCKDSMRRFGENVII